MAAPEVLVALPDLLALEWVEPGEPSPAAAERFGRELAGLHRAGAPSFGAEWPGFIGTLPAENTPHPGPWSAWFAERRLLHTAQSVDRGALGAGEVTAVRRWPRGSGSSAGTSRPPGSTATCGPANVLWARRPWLAGRPAAPRARETDWRSSRSSAARRTWGGSWRV